MFSPYSFAAAVPAAVLIGYFAYRARDVMTTAIGIIGVMLFMGVSGVFPPAIPMIFSLSAWGIFGTYLGFRFLDLVEAVEASHNEEDVEELPDPVRPPPRKRNEIDIDDIRR